MAKAYGSARLAAREVELAVEEEHQAEAKAKRKAERAERAAAFLAEMDEHGDIARAVNAAGITWADLDRQIVTDDAFAERMCEALDRHGVDA